MSTFLDPNFGLNVFPPEDKEAVIKRMKTLLLAAQMTLDSPALSNNASAKSKRVEDLRKTNYIVFKQQSPEAEEIQDKIDGLLGKYIKIVGDLTNSNTDALFFWRSHECVFPGLAMLAKKFLSVQASSAACERMFSIAGHIFSVKRRRLGIKFFMQLLFLKLNEALLD